jgi:hypothetical protein
VAAFAATLARARPPGRVHPDPEGEATP